MKCKHCGVEIRHYCGRLYHEIGALIFPQYCKEGTPIAENHATDSGGWLHEPLQENTNELQTD
jgi:hypothetical protein